MQKVGEEYSQGKRISIRILMYFCFYYFDFWIFWMYYLFQKQNWILKSTRKRMRSMYICQYKMISKYNVNWKKRGTEAYLVCYHWYGKAYALKMFREIHKKLLTGFPLKRKLEIWSGRITFHFIPSSRCFF